MENSMIDVSLTLSYILPDCNYEGSLTDNTEISYNNLTWLDDRQKPSWQDIETNWQILKIDIAKQNCKNQAKILIADCDWSVLSDVKINNKSEFENYRTILRNYILNPVENPNFPTEPTPIWTIQPDIIIGENNG